MLNLARTHDFQVHLSPSQAYPAAVNPPSFNWPENAVAQQYRLELKNVSSGKEWSWEQVNSPMQLSFELPHGQYQWRLVATSDERPEQISEWIEFQISDELRVVDVLRPRHRIGQSAVRRYLSEAKAHCDFGGPNV